MTKFQTPNSGSAQLSSFPATPPMQEQGDPLTLHDLPDDVFRRILGHPSLTSRDVASAACASAGLAGRIDATAFTHVTLSVKAMRRFRMARALRGGACHTLVMASQDFMYDLVDIARLSPASTRALAHVVVTCAAPRDLQVHSLLSRALFPAMQTLRIKGTLTSDHTHLLSDPRVMCDNLELDLLRLLNVAQAPGPGPGPGRRVSRLHLTMPQPATRWPQFDCLTPLRIAADSGMRVSDALTIYVDHDFFNNVTLADAALMGQQVARIAEKTMHLISAHVVDVAAMTAFTRAYVLAAPPGAGELRLNYLDGLFGMLLETGRSLQRLTVSFIDDAQLTFNEVIALGALLRSGVIDHVSLNAYGFLNAWPGVGAALRNAHAHGPPGLGHALNHLTIKAMASTMLRILPPSTVAVRHLHLHVTLVEILITEEVVSLGVAVASLPSLEALTINLPASNRDRTNLRAFVDAVVRSVPENGSLKTIRTPGVALVGECDLLDVAAARAAGLTFAFPTE